MTIDTNLVDELLKDYKKAEDFISDTGLLKQLTKVNVNPFTQIVLHPHD